MVETIWQFSVTTIIIKVCQFPPVIKFNSIYPPPPTLHRQTDELVDQLNKQIGKWMDKWTGFQRNRLKDPQMD
jgi:hypothetical protein